MQKLTAAIQESLIAILCYDATPQGAKAVRALVPINSYDPYYREIAKEADAYIEKYDKPPCEHTWDIFEGLAHRDPKQKTQYRQIFDSLIETKDAINRDYVLERSKVFVRKQRAKAALQKAAPLLQRDDDASIDEVEGILGNLNKLAIADGSPGTLLNDPKQALRFLENQDTDMIPIGIAELDRMGLCPARKKYLLTLAETNVGKSWFAIHKGKTGLRHGFRVAHITCEMPEEEVSQRYCQSLFAVSKRESQQISRIFRKDERGCMIDLDVTKLKRPTLRDSSIRKLLVKSLEPLKRKPRFYIKEFPSGMLTVPRLKAHLDMLEGVYAFIPDLLIIDYPDLFDHDPHHKRAELSKIAVDLRGIAGARNMAVCGYSQVNETKQGKVIRTGRAAEGRSKEHTADIVMSLNQTEEEYNMGLMRIFVAKSRGDLKNVRVVISQALGMGQFVLDSALMKDRDYWGIVGESGEEDEDGKE